MVIVVGTSRHRDLFGCAAVGRVLDAASLAHAGRLRLAAGGGLHAQAARQQEVAGVTVGDVGDVTLVADVVDVRIAG